MSNLKLQVLLNAVDRATKPLQSIQKASKTLSGDIRKTQADLKLLNDQSGKVDGFKKSSAQLAITSQKLKAAKEEAARLAIEFKNTANPTAKQTRLMEAAKRAANDLQLKQNGLRVSVQRQRTELESSGISTRKLAAEQRRLKTAAQEANATLDRQRQSLQTLSKRQEQQANSKRRFDKTQQVGDRVRNNGAVALGVGSAALYAESRLILPGLGFDKEMSDTRAVLGLGKEDPKMAAIRKQARDIGATTAFSPTDVARTQGVLAKSGYGADDILNSTESTVNLSLASGVDIAESADIVSNMQSAFDIPTQGIQRVSDVMTKAFNSSNTSLIELGEAMKYVAPVANAAGATIEDTAAMLGVMAKAGLRGSMAGTGASAVFTRLQAPVGQSGAALNELGVKTRDKKGNMLPVEKILKDINSSFKKNKLGTAQQAEYLKVIFGEEAMKGAISLIQAAGNGELRDRKNALLNSKGSAASVAGVKVDNLDGDLKNLQSAYEDMQIEVFEKQDSSLRRMTQSATDWLGVMGKWVKVNPELTGALIATGGGTTALIAGLGLLGVVVGPVIKGVGYLWAGSKGLIKSLWWLVRLTTSGLVRGLGLTVRAFGLLGPVLLKVGKALLWLGRVAMTNPLILIASLIAMAAVYIWANWETLGPRFKKLWDTVAAWTSSAWNGITNWLGNAWAKVVGVFQSLPEKFSAIWQAVKDGAVSILSTYLDWLRSFWGAVFDTVAGLPDKFLGIWQSVKDGAITILTAYLDWLKSFWGRVFDTVLELPGKFKAAGSAMIDALIDGISSKWEALKTKLTSVTDYLPDWMKSDKAVTPNIKIPDVPPLSLNKNGPLLSVGPSLGDVQGPGAEQGNGNPPAIAMTATPVRAAGRRDNAPPQPVVAPQINIHPQPGQNPQDIAREVARQIQMLMRTQAASARSAM